MTRIAPGFALLLVLLLAGCGGGTATNTPVIIRGGIATNTAVVLPADLPSYPNLVGGLATLDSGSFPQRGQYDAVQAFTFTSLDSVAAIGQWYKDQLTSKGWQVIANGTTLLGLTTANRDKLIEIFFTPSAGAAAGTHVIVYYASGRKPTPTP